MKTVQWLCVMVLLVSVQVRAQYYNDGSYWWRYGDWYPTTPRPYGDIAQYLSLQGPGNENPGDYEDYDQGDSRLLIPLQRKKFIARQFKYVLFDQGSFCASRGGCFSRCS